MELKINNKKVVASKGETILEVLRANGFDVPTLCHHPDLDVKANCRVCVVEVKGAKELKTACSTLAEDGMEILTESLRVKKARRINLELLFASHAERCSSCTLVYNCDLLRLATKHQVQIGRFKDRKLKRKTYQFSKAVEIDGTQCIDCQNCLEACNQVQKIDYLRLAGSGYNQEIVPNKDKTKACIYCGQCTLSCPVAAAQEQMAWPAVLKALSDKTKIVVAQFAPAVRVTLGEEFGLPDGYNAEGQIYTALKKLGFKYVFDINFGADITTFVEAEELINRLKDPKAAFPMMTSCCPAWVSYVEFYHPELIPNLTTARSPQIHLAGAIKTYFAKHKKINPKNIVVVSIVPCTAKKHEAKRPELSFRGKPLVDLVLTTRELAYVIKKQRLDFKHLLASEGQALFNQGSGAAAIYGASGGVMESALRSASALLGDLKEPVLELEAVRGLAGVKEASIKLAGKKIKVAVVNGIGNIDKVLGRLKKYHYVEVMSCPGGCLGGGGGPLRTTKAIKAKRLASLYAIDSKRPIRRAHENLAMRRYYDYVKKEGLARQLLETKFTPTTRAEVVAKKSPVDSFFSF